MKVSKSLLDILGFLMHANTNLFKNRKIIPDFIFFDVQI